MKYLLSFLITFLLAGNAGVAFAANLGEDLQGAGFKIINISGLTIGTNTVNGAANIVGDVNISGNVYASNLGAAATVSAAKVSAGVFGSLSNLASGAGKRLGTGSDASNGRRNLGLLGGGALGGLGTGLGLSWGS